MSWPECPICGGKTKVTDSRLHEMGVRRRYKCLSSNDHRWSTMEVMAEKTSPRQQLLTINGETKTIAKWAKDTGVGAQVIMNRLARNLKGTDLIKPGAVHVRHTTLIPVMPNPRSANDNT